MGVKADLFDDYEKNKVLQNEFNIVRNEINQVYQEIWSSKVVKSAHKTQSGERQGIGYKDRRIKHKNMRVSTSSKTHCEYCKDYGYMKKTCRINI